MAPLTDISGFYDRLAPDYDRMTGFENRIAKELPFFRSLVEQFGVRVAMDAGSGTGLHSILLAQLGVQVTALDVSRDMLGRLERHAREKELAIKTLCANFLEIPRSERGLYDAVFCMGNSLPHILSRPDLLKAMEGFATVLKPGGVLFGQILNYDRILSSRESIQSVKEEGDKIFVRYYEFGGDQLKFNILTIERGQQGIRHHLETILLRPILESELTDLLPNAGFRDVQFFGNSNFISFDRLESRDLLFLAHRS